MNDHSESGGGKQIPAKKPETVAAKVMDALLVTANKSASALAAMGIAQDSVR